MLTDDAPPVQMTALVYATATGNHKLEYSTTRQLAAWQEEQRQRRPLSTHLAYSPVCNETGIVLRSYVLMKAAVFVLTLARAI